MSLPLAAAVILGFAPMLLFAWIIYGLDRFEKEPLALLGGVFTWGAVVAAGAAFLLNSALQVGIYLFTHSEAAANFATSSLVAPITEETLKCLAVLLVFVIFRSEFDSPLDGIVYAAITALGFAATENAYYIYTLGYLPDGWAGLLQLAFIRIVLVGWQHPFYTAFFGLGLALARLRRRGWARLGWPLLGFGIGVVLHGAHNLLAYRLDGIRGFLLGAVLDWGGWLLMFLVILWAIWRESQWLTQRLREEVQLGIISPAQYRAAISLTGQIAARLQALLDGRWRTTTRFFQVCAELAYKKEQLATLGEERGNSHTIASLRQELARLATKVAT
jgi:RsiW-degrading membrane proteinase PrsW (M82 family)